MVQIWDALMDLEEAITDLEEAAEEGGGGGGGTRTDDWYQLLGTSLWMIGFEAEKEVKKRTQENLGEKEMEVISED